MHEEAIIYLLKIIEVSFIASIKFLVSPFEAERQGFNFMDSFLITTTGGFTGIIAFTFIGDVIAFGWNKLIGLFKKRSGEKEKKKFTWSKKLIIRTKMKFGLLGLVIITPCILSIPIGTFAIHRFYRKKTRNIIFLTVSLVLWSLLLNGLAQYLRLSQYVN